MDILNLYRPFVVAAFAAVLFTAESRKSAAQWPTRLADTKTLAAGANLRAADVMATPDGGAVVAFAGMTNGSPSIKASRYKPNGGALWENSTAFHFNKSVWIKVLPHADAGQFNIAAGVASPDSLEYSAINSFTGTLSLMDGFRSGYSYFFGYVIGKAAILLKNKKLLSLLHDMEDHKLVTDISEARFHSISPGTLTEFATAVAGDSGALIAYTHRGIADETASRVMYAHVTESGLSSNPVRAAEQGAEHQSAAQLTPHNAAYMLTWIGNLDGQRHLYCKVVTQFAGPVNDTRQLFSNILNYYCAPSNLGAPVIGGVFRTLNGDVPTDTLFVGLIDPINGNTLTLPLLEGFGYRVKYLHQETSGDFTLIYSVPENNTTLLKVRRISAATLSAAWETTVADLGNAPEKFIDEYPNTWISNAGDGGYYIATRTDKLYSEHTKLNLVRLRNDGRLGGADDVQKPTNFVAAVTPASHVLLTWRDNSPAETSYLVGRTKTDFDAIELIGVLPPDAESFTDTTALPGETYKYYVSPFIEATGALALSDERIVTVPAL